ncbi:uncharacterized protein BO95DRAFT_152879 [Aspergillus brunneoviolaceus CBS 621.78]|uniref:Uncharacterized protein n=1 Tax=Aspergillus brunneoviolaceus CBS 621.78 TaxID=1450534 RepID=A0ACD1G7B9_9EURO|nr:hypothetical protein BO95DRAFT_152879 [Aspergillus brunneoviolaceus CBS 621.78]RAH45049.1 hypothetical protein BO95DRAFT_152879 [Aspergillus brunneoviolaceus CBS 621.78]
MDITIKISESQSESADTSQRTDNTSANLALPASSGTANSTASRRGMPCISSLNKGFSTVWTQIAGWHIAALAARRLVTRLRARHCGRLASTARV